MILLQLHPQSDKRFTEGEQYVFTEMDGRILKKFLLAWFTSHGLLDRVYDIHIEKVRESYNGMFSEYYFTFYRNDIFIHGCQIHYNLSIHRVGNLPKLEQYLTHQNKDVRQFVKKDFDL